jgi:PEGA domain
LLADAARPNMTAPMTKSPARALPGRRPSAARRAHACAAVLASLAAPPGCAVFDQSTQISLASDPPGARILVNASDSGFVTPCVLALDASENARIDLEYPGYVTATRVLTPDHQVYAVLWRDMYTRSEVWHFPLWLNARDFFVPVSYDSTLSPARLYVRLEREADG